MGIVFGKDPQHLGHTHGHPSVSAAPCERRPRSMIEKSRRPLDRIQIELHLPGCSINVFFISRHTIGLRLNGRDHEHVVEPEPRLPRVAPVGPLFLRCQEKPGIDEIAIHRALLNMHRIERPPLRQSPLTVGIHHTQFQATGVMLLHVNFQGDSAEYVIVHMVRFGKQTGVVRKQRLKLGNQAGFQLLVPGFVSEPKPPEPGTDIRIGNLRPRLVNPERAPVLRIGIGNEPAGKQFPDLDRIGLRRKRSSRKVRTRPVIASCVENTDQKKDPCGD